MFVCPLDFSKTHQAKFSLLANRCVKIYFTTVFRLWRFPTSVLLLVLKLALPYTTRRLQILLVKEMSTYTYQPISYKLYIFGLVVTGKPWTCLFMHKVTLNHVLCSLQCDVAKISKLTVYNGWLPLANKIQN